MTAFKMPNGQSLRQYCLEHKISYRIAYILCDEKGLNPADAIERASNPRPKNRKHYVDGLTLKEFCRKNNIPYDAVLKQRKKYPDYSIQECAYFLKERYSNK